ncbi:MAG: ATP cone domain-containing protein [Candidatus Paceibacteria bacterium]
MSSLVLKADGTTEYFKVEKLRRSLRRAGANNNEIQDIINAVNERLYDGIRTQQIYRFAFERLRKSGIGAATRYSLRRALFGLGPTGFPFERFLARLFTTEGYTAVTGTTLPGRCVEHEIDLACYDGTHSFVAEAKFHSRPGVKTDLQVAMYSYARLLDLKEVKICVDDYCGIKEFWLITNTKFTSSAQKYATCMGLKLLSWDYPKHDNLHDRIQRAGIYPITTLSSLSHTQITSLISRDIILCRELLANPTVLNNMHLTSQKQAEILAEAKLVVSPRNN